MTIGNDYGFLEDSFEARHIGINQQEKLLMLTQMGFASFDDFIDSAVPKNIRFSLKNSIPKMSEFLAKENIFKIAKKNKVFKTLIGNGFYNTITPTVIKRNILENPSWYTQYTPYQPEISQGRLEALVNFQTLICDMTKMDVSNASLLDEATSAAEAFNMALNSTFSNDEAGEKNTFFIAQDCFSQTIEVIKTRAKALNIEVALFDPKTFDLSNSKAFGYLIQSPNKFGEIIDYKDFVKKAKDSNCFVCVATDLLALTLMTPPGIWGPDVVVGSAQRFGIPLGFGGPHPGFIACTDSLKRLLPGRIVGYSEDVWKKPALRLALQTREQHIRREKATSNICTSQALLAIMASMYGVYHGYEGLKRIGNNIHLLASSFKESLTQSGFKTSSYFFDTVCFNTNDNSGLLKFFLDQEINIRIEKEGLCISFDETSNFEDLQKILSIISSFTKKEIFLKAPKTPFIPSELLRKETFLQQPVFSNHRSETKLMRYIKTLEKRDLSLTHSMIPLGSCTMKLNAAAELEPVSFKEFSGLHPYVPVDQAAGYLELIDQLKAMLVNLTGLDSVSLQPNSGAQGEYTGLLVIKAYHEKNKDYKRNVCLIPASAHGTNPASAALCGLKVQIIKCDDLGNVSLDHLKELLVEYKSTVAALMITYPSTHGVFEETIKEITSLIHKEGALVYMDGANFNALVGLVNLNDLGVDVCHLNLHKTFCIPHGGGGPGAGPIAVGKILKNFLPRHSVMNITDESDAIGSVSQSPYGSASLYPITHTYITMMGTEGLREATKTAILNGNYLAFRLKDHFPILYKGKNGLVAHECILDMRPLKKTSGIEVTDIAKRLMDYGFHAPTVSFPVPGTLMIEPTESEGKEELDRFCEAMISIRKEIKKIESGVWDKENNPLKNAPHTQNYLMNGYVWDKAYSMEEAFFPSSWVKENKFWPYVGRIQEAFGDRNFCCTIPKNEE